jgi:hypothetical protein
LRHVNVLLILNFMLILISDNLPRALLHISSRTELPRVVLMSALGFCVLMTAFTPQEWAPPSVSLDLIHRHRDDGRVQKKLVAISLTTCHMDGLRK